MSGFMLSLLETSLIMSLLIGIFKLINRYIGDKYHVKYRYLIWIIVMVGLLTPFKPQFFQSPVHMDFTSLVIQQEIQEGNESETGSNANAAVSDQAQSDTNVNKPSLLAIIAFEIWLFGFLIIFLYHIVKYYRYLLFINRWGIAVTDKKVLAILDDLQNEIGIKKRVLQIKTCKCIKSPMLIGFIKPTVFLPADATPYDQLKLVLKHEIVHYKRKDLWIAALSVLAGMMHWFNPLVYRLNYIIQTDCELSCDAIVLEDHNIDERKHYGETIINTVPLRRKRETVFSTNFFGDKRNMKMRLSSIMDIKSKSKLIAIVLIVLVSAVTIFSNSFISYAYTVDVSNADVMITAEKAQEIALDRTGGGMVLLCSLMEKDEAFVYEVEISYNEKKFQVTIDAYTGSIISYSEDGTSVSAAVMVTTDRAKEIALEETGGGTVLSCDLVNQSDMWAYIIKVEKDDVFYEVTVNAADGSIISCEDIASENGLVSEERAIEIALEKTNGGVVTECVLNEAGTVYSMKITSEGVDYFVDVSASNGDVFRFEMDKLESEQVEVITESQAKELAVTAAGGGGATSCSYDNSNNVYNVQVIRDNLQYQIQIDAFSGEVKNVDSVTISSSGNSTAERLSVSQIREIALTQTGGGSVTKCRLFTDQSAYAVQVVKNNVRYAMTINATTGVVSNFKAF